MQVGGADVGMIQNGLAVRERINVVGHREYLQFKIKNYYCFTWKIDIQSFAEKKKLIIRRTPS
jgi:hypothetical protein